MESPKNRLRMLNLSGQSLWYDDLSRNLIQSGTLKQLIENDGLSGITSNPSIFEKAISEGKEYRVDQEKPLSIKALYEALVIGDIQEAADLLLPVYEKTDGRDGYVSLEVSPDLAYDTEGTLSEAIRLFQTVGRKNVMIKIPGTTEGLPAIEHLIAEGLNINVTLLFSVQRYEAVASAYMAGLERRVRAGQDIRGIASVASFFVSRIDTAVDAALSAKPGVDPTLFGQAAIANAKRAYRAFQTITQSARFRSLQEKGASAQRLLWASTSTKNKAYPDTHYVDALIGKDTVNTLPAATLNAFRDHGTVSNRLTADVEEADKRLAQIAAAGVDLDKITEQLLADGVTLFSEAFNRLMRTLYTSKTQYSNLLSWSLGPWEQPVFEKIAQLEKDQVLPRLWKKDPTLWPSGSPLMLGWLERPACETVQDMLDFAQSLRGTFRHAVLIGIGGSSLCPKALGEIFGKQLGFPELHVLDTVLPDEIRFLTNKISLADTIFIVASKSGSTIEPMTLFKHFYEQITGLPSPLEGFNPLEGSDLHAGEHFVAITDPGSPFMRDAQQHRFLKIFEGNPDIGGRYFALSPFGLVPAAIMGSDLTGLLDQADKMRLLCDPHAPFHESPCRLGAAIGQLALEGKDKLTFIASPRFVPFTFWLEQLIAESTGKNGMGIIPIVDEPARSSYPQDRTFVYLRYDQEPGCDARVAELEAAGHPVIRIAINNLIDLGGQFFLWEMATAVAGRILNVNPFDQPNVEESKKNTLALLDQKKRSTEEEPIFRDEAITVYTHPPLQGITHDEALFARVMAAISPLDYVALNAYLPRTEAIHEALQTVRRVLLEKKQVATTLGYGPAYLHSSGQLHKGGPNTGVIWNITAASDEAIPIPEKTYTFGRLAVAQAAGDFRALREHQRRVLHIHFSKDARKGLERLCALIG